MSLRNLLRYSEIGRILLIPFRFLFALRYCGRMFWRIVKWSFQSKEYYNHSYHLEDLNRQYLTSFGALVTGYPSEQIDAYIQEIESDKLLKSQLETATQESGDRHSCDKEPRFGRRLAWYAIVRATKPRVVIETGVDRGLGTVVLAAAIKKNSEEGYPGIVIATDILERCGHLLVTPYREYAKILLGDSVELLRAFPDPVDIFIHDSDHRPEYEWAEFIAIEPRLHAESIVMSDNSQQSPKCMEFAQRLGKSFIYFQDQPKDHWWPGDGIGAGFTPGRQTTFQSLPTKKDTVGEEGA